jgi:hypothetical protein
MWFLVSREPLIYNTWSRIHFTSSIRLQTSFSPPSCCLQHKLHFPLLIIPSSNANAVFVVGLATIYKTVLCPYLGHQKSANSRRAILNIKSPCSYPQPFLWWTGMKWSHFFVHGDYPNDLCSGWMPWNAYGSRSNATKFGFSRAGVTILHAYCSASKGIFGRMTSKNEVK